MAYSETDPALVTITSQLSVAESVDSFRKLLRASSLIEFALIDHAALAHEANLVLEDETVIIFGAPSVGTALMQADPRVGLELPLRVLVRAVPGGSEISYSDPASLASTYELAPVSQILARLSALLHDLATTNARKAAE